MGYAALPNIRVPGKFGAQGREVLGSKAEKSRFRGAIVSTSLLFGSHDWGGGGMHVLTNLPPTLPGMQTEE